MAVTLVANGGSGYVRDGAQLDCDGTGGACSAQYDSGTTVTLTATPGPRSTFAGWGGACAPSGTHESCRVRLDEARAVTAGFVRVAVTPPLVRSPVAPEQVLVRFRRLTDPARATERDARTALSEVPHLLPQLRTRADTVELRYHQVEAHLRLQHVTAACAILRDVRGRAAGTQYGEPVETLIAGACSGGE